MSQLGSAQLGSFQLGAVGSGSPSLQLSGPATGATGFVSTNFTVELLNPTGPVNVTIANSVSNAELSTTTALLDVGSATATFTVTAGTAGARTISITNDAALANPSNLTYTSGTPQLAVSAPATAHGFSGEASGNFTFSLTYPRTGDTVVTPTNSVAGTWNPTTITLNVGNGYSATAAFTPSATGPASIGATGTNGAQSASTVTYYVDGLTYYISAVGSDSANGQTTGTPHQTIAGLLAYIGDWRRGITVNFRGGDTFSSTVIVIDDTNGGSELADLITFQSYGTGQATLSNTGSSTASIIQVTNSGGVKIDNLIFEGAGDVAAETTQALISFDGSTANTRENITVTNCVLSNGKDGLSMAPEPGVIFASPIITHNEVSLCYRSGFILHAGVDAVGTGYAITNPTIEHNIIHDIDKAAGAGAAGQSQGMFVVNISGGTCSYNEFYDIGATAVLGGACIITAMNDGMVINDNYGYNVGGGAGDDSFGIDLDWATTDCIVEYNYMRDINGPGVAFFEYATGRPVGAPAWGNNTVRYNVLQNCGKVLHGSVGVYGAAISNVYFYNNTLIQTAGGANAHFYFKPSGSTGGDQPEASAAVNWNVYNNIFIGSSASVKVTSMPVGAGTNAEQHWLNNLYYNAGGAVPFDWRGVSYANLAAWQAGTSQDASALSANPQLTDAFTAAGSVSAGFAKARPLTGSPAIDAALDLSQAPYSYDIDQTKVGAAYDIGAVEFISFLSAWARNSNVMIIGALA